MLEVVKFMFSKKATKITKSSPSIWRLLSKCQIDGEDFVIFVAFLENMNFNHKQVLAELLKYAKYTKYLGTNKQAKLKTQ